MCYIHCIISYVIGQNTVTRTVYTVLVKCCTYFLCFPFVDDRFITTYYIVLIIKRLYGGPW